MEDHDVHARTAEALGITRREAQILNFSFLYRGRFPSKYEDLWPVKKTPLQKFTEEVFEDEAE